MSRYNVKYTSNLMKQVNKFSAKKCKLIVGTHVLLCHDWFFNFNAKLQYLVHDHVTHR